MKKRLIRVLLFIAIYLLELNVGVTVSSDSDIKVEITGEKVINITEDSDGEMQHISGSIVHKSQTGIIDESTELIELKPVETQVPPPPPPPVLEPVPDPAQKSVEQHLSGQETVLDIPGKIQPKTADIVTMEKVETPPPVQDTQPPKPPEQKKDISPVNDNVINVTNKRIAGQDQSPPSEFKDTQAKFMVLNFQDADIRDVIMTISDMLHINYIIDQAVTGTVTIHTSEKIPIEDAYTIFEQIMAINGISLVKSGKIYKFIPSKDSLREPIEIFIGRDSNFIPEGNRIIFQIIPLNYLPAATMQGILAPLLTKSGVFIEVPGLNRIFLLETAGNIKRLLDVINALDVNIFDKIELRLYEVKNTNAAKLISEISNIFGAMGYSGKDSKNSLKFIDMPRLKSILVINAFPKLFPTIDYWMNRLDISLANVEIKLIPFKYAGGEDINNIIEELKKIFSALGYGSGGGGSSSMAGDLSGSGGGGGEGHMLEFLNIARLNSVLVINSYPDLFPKITEWLDRLDQPPTGGAMKVYVYYVQHTDAGNLSSILNQLFMDNIRKSEVNINIENKVQGKDKGKVEKREEEPPQSSFAGSPIKKEDGGPKKEAAPESAPSGGDSRITSSDILQNISLGKLEVEGEVHIIADTHTNSLIIRTSPSNYQIILDTIKKLDIMPQQVLIEVIIAEVQLDNSNRYGLEWALREKGSTNYGIASTPTGTISNPLDAGIGSAAQGLSFFVNKSDELLGMLQAFSRDSKLEVLSSPVILTSENQAASINIVNQIPIESTSVDPATNVTRSSVSFKDVGIKMNVTPKISKTKYLNLDISQEVSQLSDITTASATPAIFSRQTKTNVVVKDKQSLVIAGLMEKRDNRSDTGIPGLSKLPFFGCLFGTRGKSKIKKELLIFITPHVITNTEEASSITDDFRSKLKMLNLKLKQGFE